MVPIAIAMVSSFFTILTLKMRFAANINDHTVQSQFDLALMFVVPAIAFLIGESLDVSGIVSLVLLCPILRLYAKPNITTERSYFIKVFTTSLNHLFK